MRLFFSLVAVGLAAGCTSGPFAGAGRAFQKSPPAPLLMQVERPQASGEGQPGPVLGALREEIERSLQQMKGLGDPAPYFLAFQVTERRAIAIEGSFGGLLRSDEDRTRTLDVDLRVGDHGFDNTHPVRGTDFGSRGAHPSWQISLSDDPVTLRRSLWVATDASYKRAVEEYIKVKANSVLRVEGAEPSDDFSRESPLIFVQPSAELRIDIPQMEQKIREYSELLRGHPQIIDARITFEANGVNRTIANSEGSAIQVGRSYARISIVASTLSDDGMDLYRSEILDLGSAQALPDDAVVRERIERVVRDVLALRVAPRAEPYVGPAILEGPAAGVFAHEVLGHRLEGHRQKGDSEGQTFAGKLGERVMPDFVDVYDDPTIGSINGIALNGYYPVDDEAVPTRRAALIESGVLKGFLMSRQPNPGFPASSGHGRRQEGHEAVARQGNLVLQPSRSVTRDQLKELLLAEIRRQQKPYGLRFTVVQGGYTNTSAFGIQAFQVNPVMLYKVFPDGREELVRGASIDGTPLASLSQILAAGNDVEVFNGYCGAESGWVPVSAVSPSLLLGRVEISTVASSRNRPPILPFEEPTADAAPEGAR